MEMAEIMEHGALKCPLVLCYFYHIFFSIRLNGEFKALKKVLCVCVCIYVYIYICIHIHRSI